MAGTSWRACTPSGRSPTRRRRSFVACAASSPGSPRGSCARPAWRWTARCDEQRIQRPAPAHRRRARRRTRRTAGRRGTAPVLADEPEGHRRADARLVRRDLRGGLLRPRPGVRVLRLAVQLVGVGAGRPDRVPGDHRVLRAQDGPPRRRARFRRGGMTVPGGGSKAMAQREFKRQLNRVYGWYTGGFVVFVLALAVFEQMGLSRQWIGFIFLLVTVGLYAGIGVMSRT